MQANDSRYSIKRADIVGKDLVVHWGDGHRSSFHPIWLRHQGECETCGTSLTAGRSIHIGEIPQDITPTLDRHGQKAVQVRWSNDEHRSTYDVRWLRNHCYSDQERASRKHEPTLWDPTTIGEPPCVGLVEAEAHASIRLTLSQTVSDYGFCQATSAPTQRDQSHRIIELVGEQRQTHFGTLLMKKRAKVDDAGDITAALDPHSDETYRLSTIGITVFPVLCPSPAGGDSTLVDGFEVARRLRKESPADFELLTTLPVTTHRLDRSHNSGGPERWYMSRLPVIKLDYNNDVTGVRLNERQIAPLDAPAHQIDACYRALRRMLALVYDPALRLTFKLQAGEGLIFDNQRVFHGRTEFSPEEPTRSVLTSPVDLEEFYSNIRLLRTSLEEGASPITYGQGMLG